MIYLDNAATSFPKPRTVVGEVVKCLTQYCGNPGRGSHELALASAEKIYECRTLLADFFGLGSPERILFTCNTTHALNTALKGFLRPGAHVLLSELEHNAVYRPLYALRESTGVCFDFFPVVGLSAKELLHALEKKITPATQAVICTHASNICSLTLPLAEIGALCHQRGLRFLVDAAQSAGHLPIDMRAMHIDALAAPAHKALYGIQGAGVLALGEGFAPLPLMEGGSGSDSLLPHMPSEPPERYEAGTLPTPAIAALCEGVRFVLQRGLSELMQHEQALFDAAKERLLSLPHITVYAKEARGAVLLFNAKDVPSTDTARHLHTHGICVRAGLHCAPLAHKALQTPPDGAVRVSFGAFNTLRDVDALYQALKNC